MCLMELKGFPDYLIDDKTGLIWSNKTNKYLVMRENKAGYGRTELYINGVRQHVFNHIKVVETHGDCNGKKIPQYAKTLRELGLSIDHLNDNKLDPAKINLELVTHSENCLRREKRKMQVSTNCDLPDL